MNGVIFLVIHSLIHSSFYSSSHCFLHLLQKPILPSLFIFLTLIFMLPHTHTQEQYGRVLYLLSIHSFLHLFRSPFLPALIIFISPSQACPALTQEMIWTMLYLQSSLHSFFTYVFISPVFLSFIVFVSSSPPCLSHSYKNSCELNRSFHPFILPFIYLFISSFPLLFVVFISLPAVRLTNSPTRNYMNRVVSSSIHWSIYLFVNPSLRSFIFKRLSIHLNLFYNQSSLFINIMFRHPLIYSFIYS